MFIVAVSDPPRPSDTLTVNVFRPWLADAGVPDNAPLLATDSHAGPLTLANVSASPFGSVASPAIEELYASPTVALGLLNGSNVKVGGALAPATTVMFIVAMSDPPRPSDTLTVNVFTPWLAAAGVPDRAPLPATDSHAGPFTLANVSGSPSGSVASPAIEELYARPTVALGLVNGSLVKVGGRLAPAAALRTTNPINDCRIGAECVTPGVSVAPVAGFDPETPSAEVIVSSSALMKPLLTV